jgi:hypothetical protein
MALQKLLLKSYIEKTFEDVGKGIGLSRFLEEKFPYDNKYYLEAQHLKQPDNLLARLSPSTDGDFQTAIAIYDAFSFLTPLEAIQPQLWESLALTDLFPYMQKRWGLKETKNDDNLKSAILNHFSMKSHGLIRHGLGGLWWLVHYTVDDERANRYELTEMLFKNYTLRYIRLGVGKVIQHKEAALGILQYLKDNENKITSMESVANALTSYFNKLGAVKQLTYLDRDFFYQEMGRHIDEFMLTSSKNEEPIEA